MKTVYVLLSDGDGTMHSSPEPFGFAVETEEEAKRFLTKRFGYAQAYTKIEVVVTAEEAIDAWVKKQESDRKRRAREMKEGNTYYNILNKGEKR